MCVSSRDGLLVPSSQPIEPKWRTLSAPLHPRHVGKDDLRGLRQQRLRGPVLLVCCWRQHRFRSNPAHLLYGYGTILTAAVQGSVPRNLSAVLLHQCPAIGKWPLAVAISNIVLEVARGPLRLHGRDGHRRPAKHGARWGRAAIRLSAAQPRTPLGDLRVSCAFSPLPPGELQAPLVPASASVPPRLPTRRRTGGLFTLFRTGSVSATGSAQAPARRRRRARIRSCTRRRASTSRRR